MTDKTKAVLLVFDYNEGILTAYQLIDQVSTIFNVCDEGAADIICGFHAYKGTRKDLWSEYKNNNNN